MDTPLFTCKKCGDCCKGYGGTFVTSADIDAICGYIGADRNSFIADYCQLAGGKPVLAEGEDGYCIFWDKLCTIHPVKPRMCRQWPFIEALLVDIGNWRIMAGMCPGMRHDLPDNTIRALIRKKLDKKIP
jgi:Fe-S-cluster containining protein